MIPFFSGSGKYPIEIVALIMLLNFSTAMFGRFISIILFIPFLPGALFLNCRIIALMSATVTGLADNFADRVYPRQQWYRVRVEIH